MTKVISNINVENIIIKRPRVLLIGMPDAHSSFFEMNIAQLPQGPKLNIARHFPKTIQKRINKTFENVFNPKKRSPYMGLRLIVQNLRNFIDFELIEYPRSDKAVITLLLQNRDIKILGISIGCENRVYQAKALAQKIKSVRPDIEIIFGNYGAVAGKKLGILTEKEGKVLWDSEEEREIKKRKGLDSYTGEGVHDVRLWFKEKKKFAGDPNAPLISEAISDPDIMPANALTKWIGEKTGFLSMPNDGHKIGVSIGCTNNCSFCNTRFKFNRSKTFLYRKSEEIYHEMERVYDENFKKDDFPPEAVFFLMDENFMKEEKVKSGEGKINFIEIAEGLCTLIEQSGKNIHWGTFSDARSLLSYRARHNGFQGLVRGGLQTVWVGLESKEDVFKKRGSATTQEVEEMISEMQSYGITIIGSFIPGLTIHTEGASVKRFDSLRCFMESLKSGSEQSLIEWIKNRREQLINIISQLFQYGQKEEVLSLVSKLANASYVQLAEDIFSKESLVTDSENPKNLLTGCEQAAISLFQALIINHKDKVISIFNAMLVHDGYELLNIWEDIDWWIKQNTGCRQVMMYSITGVVGTHEHMINLSDHDFGHSEIPDNNESQIKGKRLEQIDRIAREMFYQKNGPVVLSSLLTFWDGFMKLKNSDHPADIRTATYYYWMIKRYLQQVSIALIFFNDKFFTKCSDDFLIRLAKLFREVELFSPPDSPINRKYKMVYAKHDAKVLPFFKWIAQLLRNRLIKNYPDYSEKSTRFI